jgi:hypothetical protein
MIKVRPAAGLRIIDPDRKDWIEPTGRMVPANSYWAKRLRDRDVEIVPDEVNRVIEQSIATDQVDAVVVPATKRTKKSEATNE